MAEDDKDKPQSTEDWLRGLLFSPKTELSSEALDKLAASAAAGSAALQQARAARSPSIKDSVGRRDESIRGELERAHAQYTQSPEPSPAVESRSLRQKLWHYTDHAVLGLFELLGLLFGLPFGDDLYHDKPVNNLHWVYLIIGCLFAAGGPMFPLTREISWLPKWFAPSISNAARDARVWILILLIFFLYGVAPDIYQRATSLGGVIQSQSSFTQKQVDDKIASATSAIKDQLNVVTRELEDARHQLEVIKRNPAAPVPLPPPPNTTDDHALIQWDRRLNWGQSGDASGTVFPFLTFSGHNRFKAVQLTNAYIQSGITGEKRQLLIDAGYDGRFPPSDSNPIPPEAPINLVAVFNPPLRIRDFVDKWRKIEFVAEYEDTKFSMMLGEDQILPMLRNFPDSGLGPRATKKSPQ